MDPWGDSTSLTYDRQVLQVTGLGERLKEARKSKGYTLEDLQEITKIQKRYLAGIENEEYDSMPGSFYIRAFIKQYAEAVDLDADEMLALYKGSSAKQEEVEKEERQMSTPTLSRSQSRNSTRLNEVMPKIIVALFIIVIILALIFLWRHKASNEGDIPMSSDNPVHVEDKTQSKEDKEDRAKNNDEKNVGTNNDDEDKEDEDESDKQDESDQEEKQTLEHLETNGEDAMYKLENSDTFQLEIRTNGSSWIGVMDENQNEISPGARTMEADEKLELDVSNVEKVRIRVGRTGETEIYVNGELLEYASDAITQNIHIEFHKE